MAAPQWSFEAVGTRSEDYDGVYYQAHLGSSAAYSWDDPHWRGFFTGVADRVRSLTNPRSVLDVGCARGLLVQAFREAGINARGIDISEHAIETSHHEVRRHLRVAGADEVDGTWDLITCIEVLEHMSPVEAQRAIDAMCAASDRVLISSSPADFTEPTHVNVHEPADWAAAFAERGFFRRLDVDLSFLTPWAALFERADLTGRDVVHRYERYSYPMWVEVLEKRRALLEAHRQASAADALTPVPISMAVAEDALEQGELERVRAQLAEAEAERDAQLAVVTDLRHKLLVGRDHAMGAEAEAATWRVRCERAEQDRVRAEHRANDLEAARARAEEDAARHLAVWQERAFELETALTAMRTSTTWRIGSLIVRPMHRASGRGRRAKRSQA